MASNTFMVAITYGIQLFERELHNVPVQYHSNPHYIASDRIVSNLKCLTIASKTMDESDLSLFFCGIPNYLVFCSKFSVTCLHPLIHTQIVFISVAFTLHNLLCVWYGLVGF